MSRVRAYCFLIVPLCLCLCLFLSVPLSLSPSPSVSLSHFVRELLHVPVGGVTAPRFRRLPHGRTPPAPSPSMCVARSQQPPSEPRGPAYSVSWTLSPSECRCLGRGCDCRSGMEPQADPAPSPSSRPHHTAARSQTRTLGTDPCSHEAPPRVSRSSLGGGRHPSRVTLKRAEGSSCAPRPGGCCGCGVLLGRRVQWVATGWTGRFAISKDVVCTPLVLGAQQT